MKLDLYHKKRDFKKTPEPKGKLTAKNNYRYVIQKHAASHLHYDFRLELNGVLLSWAVPKGPCLDPTVKRLAIHVEDHPIEYGDFEGIIPKGEYGGGTVMLWDNGTWLPEDDNPSAAYHKGHLRFQLQGQKLKGNWHLVRLKKDDPKAWFLIKSKDKYAKSLSQYDVTVKKPNSVLSHASMDELSEQYKNIWTKKGSVKAARKKLPVKKIKLSLSHDKMPKLISPELATLVAEAPTGNDWLHEIKFDGYRLIAFKEEKNIRLMTRNNLDWTERFPNVAKALKKLSAKDLILDGEVVILDKNQQSNFQLLQNTLNTQKKAHFVYYIFDLLYFDQTNLMPLPLLQRKEVLQKLLTNIDDATLRYSDHIIGNGEAVFKKSCDLSLEGIMSKKVDCAYQQKRSKEWVKTKCHSRQEFVIGGFTKPEGAREYFGSLFLGYYEKNGNLKFCGNVGTGFNRNSLKTIYTMLKKNITKKNPFSTNPPGATSAVWVKPVLIAEVEFTEWTNDGSLRHPSFKGMRTDKTASSIIKENKMAIAKTITAKTSQAIDLPFRLTHPNKVLYPESNITKLKLAEYYNHIKDWILPYITLRPLTIVRCPETYKKCFFQKHTNNTTPDALYGIAIKEKSSTEKCIYIKNVEGLMALVQMGTLEIHSWGSKTTKVEFPDMITIDLDPAEDVPWKKVVLAAKRIREHLLKLKLKSFVKTTGGKGLHVVIPIQPKFTWPVVKEFSQVFVQYIEATYPNDYVSKMSKAKRHGKIFIDYFRNQRGATAISAYSTRARKDAPVSVPIAWEELTNKREDTFYTIKTLPKRLEKLKKDPWRDFFKIKQSLRLDKKGK